MNFNRKKYTYQAFNILTSVSQQKNIENNVEFYIFWKLMAKKMRKLLEDRKDLVMVKINKLFNEDSNQKNDHNYLSLMNV